MSAGLSYDDRQALAPLVTCQGCGRSYYMSAPRPLCADCRITAGALVAIAESVRGCVFSARELLAHARTDAALERALSGATSPRQVGRRLHAVAGRALAGVRLVRLGRSAEGHLWAMEYTEAADAPAAAGV